MSHKQFEHKFVAPGEKLTRVDVDGKRWYELPSGVRFKSVTTALGEVLDKSAIDVWKKRVGEIEAQKVLAQASRRGTAIHTIAEKYVLNDPQYLAGQMPINVETFQSIKDELDQNVGRIYGSELMLYNETLGLAGTTDLVAQYRGIDSVIDFKTSRRTKKEEWIEGYFLQSTIYAMMFEMTYGIEIPQIVVIIAVDHDYPQVFVKKRSQYVKRVMQLFVK